MRKIVSIVLLLAIIMMLGCATHIHKVGQGAQGSDVTEARQWYVLWGLVPINTIDTAEMVGEAENYTIKTEQSVLDVIINIFTTYVTVVSRTVTVTK